MIDQARSPSPGDRARPDGFAAQAILMRHHEPESNSVMESSFMTDIYTSQIVPKLHVRDMYVAGTVAGIMGIGNRCTGPNRCSDGIAGLRLSAVN